jgi:hypothetical protein
MKVFPAKTQRRKDMLGFFAPLRLRGEKVLEITRRREIANRVTAIAIALSFVAMLVPIAASANNSSGMPCCAGKAGHCDSGLASKKHPQPKEPMCGLHKDIAEDDGITIVAEPSQTESHNTSASSSSDPAAESASLGQPCRMDCGACATASGRQQKRDKSMVLPTMYQAAAAATSSRYEATSLLFSLSDRWPSINPRGPPARR